MIHWAVEILSGGGEGVSTTLLAGADHDSEDEVADLFLRAMGEQNIRMEEHEGLEWLEAWLCQEIVEGKVSPRQGLSELYQFLWLNDRDRRFDRWLWLDESIAFVEGGEPEYGSHKLLTVDNIEETIVEEAREFLKSCSTDCERR